MRRLVIPITFLFLATFSLTAETTTFDHVKIHRQKSPQKRVLVDKVGVLTFDDTVRKLTYASHAGDKFEVRYDDVDKVVFEVTTHMRGGALGAVVSGAGFPGAVAGAIIEGLHVHDYWFYLEYKNGDQNQEVLLEVPKESSEKVIAKATGLFGSRVKMPQFPEKGEEIEPDKDLNEKILPDYRSKQTMKIDRQNHPLPEVKPDKATVVVVCPSLAARNVGLSNQFKLHANDRVIAVNKFGTYDFAYLDPGKYKFVSQAANANGFEIELEAGKSYYFLQNTFEGTFKGATALSRNSPELVMYLLNGSYFSDWERKYKPNEVVIDSVPKGH
jgi:hypothetical protein